MRLWKSTFGKSLPRVCVVGVMVSAVLALLAADPVSAAEVVVYVIPTGDDTGDGSLAKPVASLIGVRDAVRRLRADGKAGTVRVVVADAEPVLVPRPGRRGGPCRARLRGCRRSRPFTCVPRISPR